MGDHHDPVRLASELFPGATNPKLSPSAVESIAASRQSKNSQDPGYRNATHHPVSDGGSGASQEKCRSCRKFNPGCDFQVAGRNQCSECAFLDDSHLKPGQIDQFVEPLLPHRAIGGVVEQAVHQVHSSHVAAILLKNDAFVVGCDDRGQSFLKNAYVLKVAKGYLHCSDPVSQPRFLAALERTARTGRAANLLVCPIGHPEQRFSMTLLNMQDRKTAFHNSTCFNILSVLSPLDQRRFATGRQLMELFALSAAEARLTRALCHGYSLEKYASDQGLKLPTVRTQLRSVLAKTGTGRQATLIRLVAGIPVIRESG